MAFDDLMEKTMTKLEAFSEHLGRIHYTPMDGIDFMNQFNPGHTVFAAPPTYKAGYEKLEKLLRAVIDWRPPEYRELTDQDLTFYETVATFDNYFIILEKDLPEVYKILGEPAAVLPRGREKFTYILTRRTKKRLVIKPQVKSARVGPFWHAHAPITGSETLSYTRISIGQSIRLNELFLSAGIDYFTGGVGVSLAFTLDGRIIGKADFAPSAHQWKLDPPAPMIYIMSDLAVPCQTVPKLSKLILVALLSADVKQELDLQYIEDFYWAITTAFSPHPVSMKYRGVFKLHTRKKSKDGNQNALNYYAPFAERTLAESFDLWLKKYHRKG